MIVDFDTEPPTVKPGHVRSEQVQATLLDELLGLFVREGIEGPTCSISCTPRLVTT
jgi:hypothetical protein